MKLSMALVLGALALLLDFHASANDSFAAIKAGGLELKKSDGIVMESEDLYLSPSEVRVKYVFYNDSQKDISSIVAFPVPAIDVRMENASGEQILTDSDPFKFKVMVDGKPVETKFERKEIKPNMFSLMYYWNQVFPKGRRLEVAHTYAPMVGGFFYIPEYASEEIRRYCIDPPLRSTLAKIMKKDNPSSLLLATELVYILSTGSNWKGPIKDFRMIIDKEKPSRYVSLCIDGIKKIDATRFEVKKENFTPKKDIEIVFLEVPPKE